MATLIGQTSAGTNTDFSGSGNTALFPYLAATSGAVTTMYGQFKVANPSLSTVKLAIYDHDPINNRAGNLLGSVTVSPTPTGTTLFSGAISSVDVVAGAKYWIGWYGTGEQLDIQGDSAAAVGKEYTGNLPNPAGSTLGNMAVLPVIYGDGTAGTATPVLVSRGAYGSGTTSFTAAVPTGFAANDMLVIVMESSDSTTAAGTPSTPANWTKIFEETQGGGSSGVTTLTIFAKVSDGTETNVTVSGIGDHGGGVMFAVRGAKHTSTSDIQVGTGNGAASGNGTVTGLTTASDKNLIVAAVAITRDAANTANFSAWTNAGLTSITELHDQTVTSGAGGGIGVAYGNKAAAGATGNSTVTISTSAQWRAVHLAFPPPVTGYNLDVSPGSYAFSGTTTLTLADRLLGLGIGSYAFTGVAESNALTRALLATPGSYALTGDVASLLSDRLLSVSPGGFSLSGVDVDLVYVPFVGYSLDVDPGSYALTGDTALTLADKLLGAAPGSFAFTGAVASLLADLQLSGSPGSYVLTGDNALVLAARLLGATPGSFALTGTIAALLADLQLSGSPGSYAVTGGSAGIVAARLANAAPGAFVVNGDTADMLRTLLIETSPGVYTLTGNNTTLEGAAALALIQCILIQGE